MANRIILIKFNRTEEFDHFTKKMRGWGWGSPKHKSFYNSLSNKAKYDQLEN